MTENQRLKIIRKFLKETQEDFGPSLGLTQAGYSDIERGKNSVSGRIKILLKREHNINLRWLETGEGKMFTATIEDREMDSDKLGSEQHFFERLQSEIERLQNEVKRLSAENNSYCELVRSKNLIIENLESRINQK
ncbi:helix-turn-helix domain-containing protein [Algoriphagus algorifonticola]|uniref:helix-turn-helix domain-containing protein n=1 Tax=Algoriphagus algorifonticola TaxID=2593007 RepID=UPI00119EF486|nr:helix-turn-helix transcriptional regulator [Algoriphagus algorifonticola]